MTELVYFKTKCGFKALSPVGKPTDFTAIIIDGVKKGALKIGARDFPVTDGRAIVSTSALEDGKNTPFLYTGMGIEPLEPFEKHGKAIALQPLSDNAVRELLKTVSVLEKRLSELSGTVSDISYRIDSEIL